MCLNKCNQFQWSALQVVRHAFYLDSNGAPCDRVTVRKGAGDLAHVRVSFTSPNTPARDRTWKKNLAHFMSSILLDCTPRLPFLNVGQHHRSIPTTLTLGGWGPRQFLQGFGFKTNIIQRRSIGQFLLIGTFCIFGSYRCKYSVKISCWG